MTLEAARPPPAVMTIDRAEGVLSDGSGTTVVEISGEIDLLSAVAVAPVVEESFRPGVGAVVLDLSGVDYFSARGVHLVVAAGERARYERRTLVVVAGGNRAVGRVLDLFGIHYRSEAPPGLAVAGRGDRDGDDRGRRAGVPAQPRRLDRGPVEPADGSWPPPAVAAQ